MKSVSLNLDILIWKHCFEKSIELYCVIVLGFQCLNWNTIFGHIHVAIVKGTNWTAIHLFGVCVPTKHKFLIWLFSLFVFHSNVRTLCPGLDPFKQPFLDLNMVVTLVSKCRSLMWAAALGHSVSPMMQAQAWESCGSWEFIKVLNEVPV